MNVYCLLDIIQGNWIKSLRKQQQKRPNPVPTEFIFYP